MANYEDLLAAESTKKSEVKPSPPPVRKDKPIVQSVDQSINQSTDKPTNRERVGTSKPAADKSVGQSTSQSISRLTSQSTTQSADNSIVDRPKAFYILKRLDRKIDDAVRYLQDKRGIKKVDRSVIVNAYLDNDSLWTDESLDQLVDQVISQLTSRLTGQ